MMLKNARNDYDGTSGYKLMGKSIAFYGYGAVARCMQKLASCFGMTASAYDPYLTKEQIEAGGANYCATVQD